MKLPTTVAIGDGCLCLNVLGGTISEGNASFQGRAPSFGNNPTGWLYTLTARIGSQNAINPLDVGLALGPGSATLADVFPPPGQASFAFILINGSNFTDNILQDQTITLNTTEFPASVGQPINISLIGNSEFKSGREAFFDNIRLTSVSSAPEPSLRPESKLARREGSSRAGVALARFAF